MFLCSQVFYKLSHQPEADLFIFTHVSAVQRESESVRKRRTCTLVPQSSPHLLKRNVLYYKVEIFMEYVFFLSFTPIFYPVLLFS